MFSAWSPLHRQKLYPQETDSFMVINGRVSRKLMPKYPAQELRTCQKATTRNPCNLISGLCQEQTAMSTFPCLHQSPAWWPSSCPPESPSSHLPSGSPDMTLSPGQTCCLSAPCPQTPGSLIKPDLPTGTGNMEAALRVTVLEGKESHSAGGKGGPMSLGLSLSLISPPCQDCNTWFFIQSRGRL